jgi:hypothetical protein
MYQENQNLDLRTIRSLANRRIPDNPYHLPKLASAKINWPRMSYWGGSRKSSIASGNLSEIVTSINQACCTISSVESRRVALCHFTSEAILISFSSSAINSPNRN